MKIKDVIKNKIKDVIKNKTLFIAANFYFEIKARLRDVFLL